MNLLKLAACFCLSTIFVCKVYPSSLSGSRSVFAGNSVSVLSEMVVEGGSGSESSSAIEVFVPMKRDSGDCTSTDASECFYLYGSGYLPYYTDDTTGGVVKFEITVDNDSYDDLYLYAGIVDEGNSSNMTTISGSSYSGGGSASAIIGVSSKQSKNEFDANIYLNNICYIHNSNGGNCNYLKTNSGNEIEEEVTLYFFKTDTFYNQFVDLNISSFPNGVFYKLKLSNNISSISSVDVNLNELRKGDNRVKAIYSGSVISDFHDVIGIKYSVSNLQPRQNIQVVFDNDSGAIVSSDDNDVFEEGEITIKGLTNNQPANVSVGFVNKWQFLTKLSPSLIQTPEDIQVFIESQACYLLSAGFQENHYILDYFKKIRDKHLLTSALGKRFVEFYYDTAPKFAPYIYKNKLLSSSVRFFSHVLYFVFNKFYIVFMFTFILFALIGVKMKFSNKRKQGV